MVRAPGLEPKSCGEDPFSLLREISLLCLEDIRKGRTATAVDACGSGCLVPLIDMQVKMPSNDFIEPIFKKDSLIRIHTVSFLLDHWERNKVHLYSSSVL